jgi:phosphatidylserine decarboxylase
LKISREGYATIALVIALWMGSVSLWLLSPWMFLWPVVVLLGLVTLLIVYFFRDPERLVPSDPAAVVSPADGRVVLIQDVHESRFLQGPARQISIFLSVFNVHVNRTPIQGTVRQCDYVPGSFLAAFNHRASLKNEQTVVGIEGGHGRVLFKQIAGLLARRIVCNLHEGDVVTSGQRFGIIKFGSRVDVFLPPDADIRVFVGTRVRGGETILARLNVRHEGGAAVL